MPIEKQNENHSGNNGDTDKDRSAHKKKLKLKKESSADQSEPRGEDLARKTPKNNFKDDNNKLKKKVKLKTKSKGNSEVSEQVSIEQSKNTPVDERIITVDPKLNTDDQVPPKLEEISHRDDSIYYLTGKGKQHPVHEMLQKLREILLSAGFNEVENQYFVPEKDIFQQYTRKSGLVLNKTFYLGETQKLKLELQPETLTKLKNVFAHLEFDEIKFLKIIREFNNNPNLHELFLRLKNEMEFSNVDISHLIDELAELKQANPALTSITLRSKMDSPWMSTLNAIMDKENLPLKVFSSGIWFKREMKPGEQSLRTHYGVSCIIIDDNITLDKGKILFREILERVGIKDIEIFDIKENKEYKIHQKEFEVVKDNVKVGTFGLFSKKMLENYNIETPVLYMNFGLEHLVMIQKHIDDIRELMYPQFHSAWKLDDLDIAKAIQFKQTPKTELGVEIAKRLYNICLNNNHAQSPCEFIVWEGPVTLGQGFTEADKPITNEPRHPSEKQLTVKVVRKDKGSKLCGPAMLNEIVVKDGDIIGVQNPDQNQELAGAVKTKINFLRAFSKYVGYELESRLASGELEAVSKINAGIVKNMDDINLQLDGRAVRYISSNNKNINVRGPLFVTVEFEISNPQEMNIKDNDKPVKNENPSENKKTQIKNTENIENAGKKVNSHNSS